MNQNEGTTYTDNWIEDGKVDYLVIGSGLCESIVSYLLSISTGSPTVLQVDPSSSYGQSWAAVQPDQLKLRSSSSSTPQTSSTRPPNNSSYALSLQPTLVPARGKFVDTLISSNVAPYLTFQLLHAFILAQPDHSLLPLPGSKHDLFRMSDLSLIEKRLLTRFLQSVLESGSSLSTQPDQSLLDYLKQPPYLITNPKLCSIIAALALSPTANPSAQAVLKRLATLSAAIGRHSSPSISALPAALLLGEYGGGGEWAEGFVRAAAVTGRAIQVIGRPILSLQQSSDTCPRWSIRLGSQAGQPLGGEAQLEFSAKRLLISQEYLSLLLPDLGTPKKLFTILRGIAIVGSPGLDKLRHLEKKVVFDQRCAHGLIVFPPEEGGLENPVHGLFVGPESGSCPEDEQVIYLSSIVETDAPAADPSSILQPVLQRLLSSSTSSPDQIIRFTHFYSQDVHQLSDPSLIPSGVLVIPSWPDDIERSTYAEVVEWIVEAAQRISEVASSGLEDDSTFAAS